jgi:hypothetical protein
MLANDSANRHIKARARLFGRVVPWVVGAAVAILLSMQTTTWARGAVRTWFFAIVNRAFASTIVSAPSEPGGWSVDAIEEGPDPSMNVLRLPAPVRCSD